MKSFLEIEKDFECETPFTGCYKHGVISVATEQAGIAAREMFQLGGNAFDAAISAALALAVTEPQSSGLGGQTMALLHHKGKTIMIDGSSRAPSYANPETIPPEARSVGYRAATVPSTLATLFYIHKKFGKLKWETLLQPAIEYAEHGYKLSALQCFLQKRELDEFLKIPGQTGAKYFLNNKKPYKEGSLFKQSDLAQVMKIISKTGVEEFYHGEIAHQIAADMKAHGGLIQFADLAQIPFPVIRKPVTKQIGKYAFFSAAQPASGENLLNLLELLHLFLPDNLDLPRAEYYLRFAEFAKLVLEQRGLEHFKHRYIRTETSLPSDYRLIAPPRKTQGETTHLSVMDKEKNVVSLTQSIECVYGSKTAADGLGFLYNSYIADFDFKYPTHRYYLRPNSTPRSSVCPTIVFLDKKPVLAMGSPGSERIITSLANFCAHLFYLDCKPLDAISAARAHWLSGTKVVMEQNNPVFEKAKHLLMNAGFTVNQLDSFYFGSIQAVFAFNKKLAGLSDPRRDGKVNGF